MTPLSAKLKELREVCEKATPKYMLAHPKMEHFENNIIGVDCCDEEPFVIAQPNHYMENWQNDIHFIAQARTMLPRLIEALELALYYVEGDATYESLCKQITEILEGE